MAHPPAHPRNRTRRRAAIAAAAAACVTAAAGVWFAAGSANAGSISGTLYVDPDSGVNRWIQDHPGDPRAANFRKYLSNVPVARWINIGSDGNTSSAGTVAGYVNAANAANAVPVLSVYGVPGRDCGSDSSGGANDTEKYKQWIREIAAGLGDKTVIIVLETDSLGQSCRDSRFSDLTAAVKILKGVADDGPATRSNVKVYLDAGHSSWKSASANLEQAGIKWADGFFTNVSNFQPTSEEVAYGRGIINGLASRGMPGKKQIIDISRNGLTPKDRGDWCADDNVGNNDPRRVGEYPTLNTGNDDIDGYLWVKPPGEADGSSCGFPAGSFQPTLAESLIEKNVQENKTPPSYQSSGPMVTTPPVTTPPVTTPPVTTPPVQVTTPPVQTTTPPRTASPPVVTPPVAGGCSASFKVVSSWGGGYQGQVVVTAQSAISGWAVSIAGVSVNQLWNGDVSSSGSGVTVKNVGWNGSVSASGSAEFGFIGNGAPGSATVTCSAN